MAANPWDFYNEFTELSMDGTIDMDADAFRCSLYLSTSNAATLSLSGIASLTNEHAAANGYTAGGNLLSTPTWIRSGGTTTFDSADTAWTAASGSITARFAVIWDDTVTTPVVDPLICYTLLDNTPADVTVTDTNTLTIQMNASGIFTLST